MRDDEGSVVARTPGSPTRGLVLNNHCNIRIRPANEEVALQTRKKKRLQDLVGDRVEFQNLAPLVHPVKFLPDTPELTLVSDPFEVLVDDNNG
jgi:hypothetical protein